ncbi:MAG: hypothetical protein AAF297_05415 [Planctomycetota bacterium]
MLDVAGDDRRVIGSSVRAGLPARPGVVVLEGGGRAVQVAVTGDLRAFVVGRLVESGSGRADLFGVVDRVRACVLGSAFEADFAFLEWGRELTPESYRAATDRWRGWFLRLDPESDLPVWRKTNLSDAVGAAPGTLVGPMPTKDSASRYGRGLDSVFELCREPRLLAQRPDAVACSYKEMGRCPAPCDGSEPMTAYRLRVRQALEMAGMGAQAGVDARAAHAAEAMARASAALDFEQAATLKVLGEDLETLRGRSFRRVTTLDRFGAAVVCRSTRRGWCRVLVHGRGRTAWWGDVPADGAAEAGRAVVERVSGILADNDDAVDGAWLTEAAAERIGMVCHLMARPPRGSARVVPVGRVADSSEAAEAASRVVRVMRAVCRAESDEEESGRSEVVASG